jgi:hypothetical protein
MLIEQLRYAGIVSDVKHEYRDEEDSEGIISFNLYPPKGVDIHVWADHNTARMKSFSIRVDR